MILILFIYICFLLIRMILISIIIIRSSIIIMCIYIIILCIICINYIILICILYHIMYNMCRYIYIRIYIYILSELLWVRQIKKLLIVIGSRLMGGPKSVTMYIIYCLWTCSTSFKNKNIKKKERKKHMQQLCSPEESVRPEHRCLHSILQFCQLSFQSYCP